MQSDAWLMVVFVFVLGALGGAALARRRHVAGGDATTARLEHQVQVQAAELRRIADQGAQRELSSEQLRQGLDGARRALEELRTRDQERRMTRSGAARRRSPARHGPGGRRREGPGRRAPAAPAPRRAAARHAGHGRPRERQGGRVRPGAARRASPADRLEMDRARRGRGARGRHRPGRTGRVRARRRARDGHPGEGGGAVPRPRDHRADRRGGGARRRVRVAEARARRRVRQGVSSSCRTPARCRSCCSSTRWSAATATPPVCRQA